MATQTIDLKRADGPAVARLTIGQAQFGKFGIYVFAPDKQTFSTAGTGHTPPGQQLFPLGAAANLDGFFLAWDVYVAPFSDSAGQFYSVLLEVLQDGKTVSSFPSSGQFSGATPKLLRASAAIHIS
jgi:hypothetical protein